MTRTRISVAALAAVVLALSLTACAPQSPEDAFLSAVKGDDRITLEQTDKEWLDLGNSFCDLKDMLTDEEIDAVIETTGEEVPEAGLVSEHADQTLCPDE